MTRWQVMKAAFAGYGRLPQITGKLFLPVGFIARLPFSMAPMGILVLVTYATGSYSQAGLAAGAAAIGTALSAALVGGFADRLGQRPVLLVLAPLNGASLLAIVWAVAAGHRGAAVLVLCFISGFTQPQVGPLARVRWLNMMQPGSRDINIAMSYESTADELSFVFGPALIGIIASIRPELGLISAGILSVIFVIWFALHPTATATRQLIKDGELNVAKDPSPAAGTSGETPSLPEPNHSAGYEPNPLRRKLAPALVAPGLGMVAMGTFFGGNQASITATADRWGAPSSAGLLYALMGFTAAIVALGLVVLSERITQVTRWRAAAFGLMCVAPLLILPCHVVSRGSVDLY